MRTTPSTHRKLGLRNLCAGALLLGVSLVAGAADDTALFSTSFPPNVLLMVDNSNSMNEIMRHPASVSQPPPGWPYAGCDILPDDGRRQRSTTRRPRYARRPTAATPASAAGSRSTTPRPASPPPITPAPERSRQRLHHAHVLRPDAQDLARRPADEHERQRGNDNPTWVLDDYLEWLFHLNPADTTTTYGPDNQTARPDPRGHRQLRERRSTTSAALLRALPALAHHGAARDRARRDLQDEHERHAVRGRLPAGRASQDVVRFGLAQFTAGEHGGFVKVPVGALQHERDRARDGHQPARPDHRHAAQRDALQALDVLHAARHRRHESAARRRDGHRRRASPSTSTT